MVKNKIKSIVIKFNLDPAQADEAGNIAIQSMSDFLEGLDYELLEDGINILSQEEAIIELSEGNYNNRQELEKEANIRYIDAFETASATF